MANTLPWNRLELGLISVKNPTSQMSKEAIQAGMVLTDEIRDYIEGLLVCARIFNLLITETGQKSWTLAPKLIVL